MKNKSVYLNIIFTLLFLILSALFLIYIFREIRCNNREDFEGDPYSWKYGEGIMCGGDLNTNVELRNKNSDFMKNNYNRFEDPAIYSKSNLRDTTHPYRKYCDVMNYTDLLAYRCLNKSPTEIHKVFKNANIASTIDYIYIYNESSLYSFILTKIQAQKNMLDGKKIIGPVYACISQAPYLRYESDYANRNNAPYNTFLDARIDILNNKSPYYLEKINHRGIQRFVTNTSDGVSNPSIISSLYCHILIVFPLYDTKMKIKKTKTKEQSALIKKFLDETMKKYYTDNELCFIKCNKSSALNCGCLTRTVNSPVTGLYTYKNTAPFDESRDMPSYTSRCIDHTTINNKVGDFTMMYYVNPYSDSYGDSNIIEDPEPSVPLPKILSNTPIIIPMIQMPAQSAIINPDKVLKKYSGDTVSNEYAENASNEFNK
jgi:hypothetical protein